MTKTKGLNEQTNKIPHRHRKENGMLITRAKGGLGVVEERKGEINGDREKIIVYKVLKKWKKYCHM